MKRISLLLFALALFVQATAQNYDYKPRETWPYLLEEFTSGGVHTSGGDNLNEGWYNVSVIDGKLHYIKDGRIMEADMRLIQYARIGRKMYVNRFGKMEEVVAEEGPYMLLRSAIIDMDEFAKADIGYGVSSATASTQNLTGMDISGISQNMELEAAIAGAKVGKVLPLKIQYGFMLGPRWIEASKSAVLALPGIDIPAAKAFFKQEKIKWSKPESLAKVLKYLSDNNL
ncbi:MAG: hypothetical protein J5769_06895 [Bacteroidales bacterium]|nr:hypothetical protein [Bacteroidales bacterium]